MAGCMQSRGVGRGSEELETGQRQCCSLLKESCKCMQYLALVVCELVSEM